MEQLSIFNTPKTLEDGFNYDNEGNFIGIDIKKFTIWWENYKGNKHVLDTRIEETLEKSRLTILKSEKMVKEWQQGYVRHQVI